MVTVHIHIQSISRGKGRSATSAAAYRSATRIENTRERRRMREPLRPELNLEPKGARRRLLKDLHPELAGRVNDFRAKRGVLREKVKLPPNAPREYLDRPVLWNGAEDSEPRRNSVVAREADIALPCELTLDQNWEIAEAIADWFIDRYGVGVDICIHRAAEGHDPRNTHLHIMWTTRELTEDGFGKKTRVLDAFKTRGAEVEAIRQCYEDCVNAAYRKAGLDLRIDVRSYADQGIERIPQIHVGVAGTAMADRGEKPVSRVRYDRNGRLIDWEDIDQARSRKDLNCEIVDVNTQRDKYGPIPLQVQIKNIERWIAILMERVTDLEALIPASFLPEWVRIKVEHFKYLTRLLIDLFNRKKEEEEEVREKKREQEGTLAQLRRMREQMAELERAKQRREALLRFYARIEAYVAMRPPAPLAYKEIRQDNNPPPRVLSVEQFRVELVAKAQLARAKVPPEYRPSLEIPDVVWDQPETKPEDYSLGYHFQTGPPDNRGQAEPPPPIKHSFNEMANPSPQQPYKQKVTVGFGPK